MKRALLALLGTGLLLAVAGCEQGSSPATQVEGLKEQDASLPAFLRSDARLRVAHTGLRRLEFAPVSGPGLAFRERITTDGSGHYSVQPVDSLESSVLDWNSFELQQVVHEGFIFRYRDFLGRSQRLLARNWLVLDRGQTATVAGRTCKRFRVERTRGAAVAFELSVDVEADLVLASQEYDGGGQLVASMTYETFELAPDTSGAIWHQPANDERPLDLAGNIGEQVGSQALSPRLLPLGYELLEAATVDDGEGRRWLKLTYTDGVEPLFFFQALAEPAPAGKSARMDGRAIGDPTASTSAVVVFQLGAATVVQGHVQGFDLIALGKVPQVELLDLIESALP